jgi:hypothetical protein
MQFGMMSLFILISAVSSSSAHGASFIWRRGVTARILKSEVTPIDKSVTWLIRATYVDVADVVVAVLQNAQCPAAALSWRTRSREIIAYVYVSHLKPNFFQRPVQPLSPFLIQLVIDTG